MHYLFAQHVIVIYAWHKIKKIVFGSLVTIDVNCSYGNLIIARGSPAAGGTNKEYHIIQSWDVTVVKPDAMLKQWNSWKWN